MERAGFEIIDVHSLRPHYALTLREWYRRLSARRREAAKLASERTLRVLELYLAGCSRAFDEGAVGVHQVLLAKPGQPSASPAAPLTRAETFLWDEYGLHATASRGQATLA
jgi:cyclopropane-fatty-acyl-phospholipid synthase